MKKIHTLILVAFLGFGAKAQWTQTNGPIGGNVKCIANNGSKIVAGTAGGGLYLSTNAGANWSRVTYNPPCFSYFSAVAVVGNDIYVGTGDNDFQVPGCGVYRSSDNGATWTAATNGITNNYITSFAVNASYIFVSTLGGVFRSNIGDGANWTSINNGISDTRVFTTYTIGRYLFAGNYTGVLQSTNNGASWTKTLTTSGIIDGITAIDTNNIYASQYNPGAVYISNDRGTSWTPINSGLPTQTMTKPASVISLAVNGTSVYAGTLNGVFKTIKNSITWTAENTGLSDVVVRGFVIAAGKIYIATANIGIMHTDVATEPWPWISSNDVINTSVQALAFNGNNGNFYAGTNSSGIYISDLSGQNWNPKRSGISGAWDVRAFGFTSGNEFAGVYNSGDGVVTSTNNGFNWSHTPNVDNIFSIAISGSHIYSGTTNGVYLSNDNGVTWNLVNTGLTNLYVNALATRGDTIYAGTYAGIFKSTNNGTSWNNIYSSANNSRAVFAFLITGDTIYAGTAAGVLVSKNNGTTWSSTSLTDITWSLARSGTTIFAGTNSQGVNISTNAGSSWIAINTGLPFPSITSLLTVNTDIFAGTAGGGVWKRSVNNALCSINPPVMSSSSTATICSGGIVNIPLTSTPSASYSWVATTIGNTSGANIKAKTASTLKDTITSNNLNLPEYVIYAVTPTGNFGGCTGSTQQVTVKVNPLPHVTATASPNPICSGKNITQNGGGANTYIWTGGVTNGTPFPIVSTTVYTVTGTDANGCKNTAQVTDTVNPLPTINTTVSANPICAGASITLSAFGTGTNYSWDNGVQSGVAFVPPGTTTYTATGIIQATGCSNTAVQTITVNPNGNSTFNYSAGTFCKTGTNPTPTVSVSGGTFSAPVGLSINASTGTIDLAASTIGGPYAVTYTVYAAGICPTTTSRNVTITTAPIATFSYAASPYCQGSGTVSPIFTGGGTALGFTSSPSTGLTINTSTGVITLSTSTPGSYTVTNSVAASGGCAAASSSFPITIKQSPVMTSATSDSVCSGGSINIPLSSNISSTYQWSAVANPNANISGTLGTSSPISSNLTLTTSSPAVVIYNVTPTSNGCTGTTQAVYVTVHPVPAMGSITANPICSGSSANIVLNSTVNPATFTWVAASNSNVTGESLALKTTSTIDDLLINLTNSTQFVYYTITPTSKTGGCIGASLTAAYITVNPKPVIPAQTSTICSGNAFTIAPVDNNPNYIVPSNTSYTWTYTTNAAINGGSTAVAPQVNISQTLTNTTATNQTASYSVTPVSGNCTGAIFAATVLVNPSPQIPAQSVIICSGAAFTVAPTTSGSTVVPAGTKYTWTYSAPGGGITNGGAQATPQLSISQTLTNITNTQQIAYYTVTPTSGASGNCLGAPFTISVYVNPTPAITAPFTKTICSGNQVNFTFVSTVGASYTWSATNNSNVTGESAFLRTSTSLSDTLSSGNSTAVQTVSYTVTPTTGTCAGAAQAITVSVNPVPIMNPVSTTTICSGTTVGVVLGSSIPSSYSWIGTANPNTSGVTASPQAPHTTGTIDDVISSGTLTSATNVLYTATPTATTGGCVGATLPITVTINPTPFMNNATTATTCSEAGLAITLTSAVNSNYSWVATLNSNTFGQSTVSHSGNTINDTITNIVSSVQHVYYTVTPTSTAGNCIGSFQTINVTVKPLADAGFSYTSSTFCKSGANPTPSINTVGGSFTFHPAGLVFVSSTPGKIDLAASTLGQYTLIYSINGTATACANKDSIIITITSAFNASFSYTGTPYCQGYTNPLPAFSGTSSAGAFSSTGSLQFANINTGEIDLAASPSGTYTITNYITAANGCSSATATFPIVINPSPSITSIDTANACSGSAFSITLSSTVLNSNYSWVGFPPFNPNTSGQNLTPKISSTLKDTIINISSGAEIVYYTITPTAITGSCVGIPQTVKITVNPLPIVSFTGLTDSVCLKSSPQILTGTPLGAGGAFSINGSGISGNTYTPIAVGSGAHTITYTYTDANSCINTFSQSVSVLPGPVTPEICEVTVDTLSTHNIIYWDKTAYTNVKEFLVYRDTANNNYALIGTVPFTGAYSLFEDTLRHLYSANGDPNASSWRYKIALKDTCDSISVKSLWHQTVFFQDPGTGFFNWSQYQIEGQTVPASNLINYKFYRDTLSNGNWYVYQTLSASSTSATDIRYALYPNGRWRVIAGWNVDCTPTLRTSASISTTRSNIKNRTAVGIINNAAIAAKISIVPNPAKDQITINTTGLQINSIQIFDLTGREVNFNVPMKQLNNEIIDVSKLVSAIYTVTLRGKDFVINKKLVISR